VERWKAEKAIVRSRAAFYVIEQTFEIGGRRLVRTGVLGQARLAPWGKGGIFPHEVTLPKPKEDRLRLYRATGVAPGPSFSLFEDAGGKVRAAMGEIKAANPYWTADGPEGSSDRVWKVTDGATIKGIEEAVAGEKFFIADGHHRYETALAYREELAAKGALAAGHPANFVLMCAVAFDDPGLVVLPTHRLLHLASQGTAQEGLRALEADYTIVRVASLDGFARGGAMPAGIAIYAGGGTYLLRMKGQARAAFVREAGEVMAGINTYEVLEKVLPRFFEDVGRAVAAEEVKYTHDLGEAAARVDSGASQAAVVLAGITVRQIAEVASMGRTMPPKSTYFYPKLPTGVAIKPLG
jgi:uncharacterized protein (DUF1015 family)